MLLFAVGLYINDNGELVVGNSNVNHNYWDVYTGLDITNNKLDNVLNLECKYMPMAGADMAAMLVYHIKVIKKRSSSYHLKHVYMKTLTNQF